MQNYRSCTLGTSCNCYVIQMNQSNHVDKSKSFHKFMITKLGSLHLLYPVIWEKVHWKDVITNTHIKPNSCIDPTLDTFPWPIQYHAFQSNNLFNMFSKESFLWTRSEKSNFFLVPLKLCEWFEFYYSNILLDTDNSKNELKAIENAIS